MKSMGKNSWRNRSAENLALLTLCLILPATHTLADCTDLKKGNAFSLIRHEPYFEVTNTVSQDGTLVEKRKQMRNGVSETVTTEYWNGVIAVDRKSNSSHIELILPDEFKSVNLKKAGKTYEYPVKILVNGDLSDTGSVLVNTMAETFLTINGCNYPIMVVRTSIKRNNGDDINEEALLSLEAGMLLGNVAMTPTWVPKHGVFYDVVKAE